MAKLLRLPEGQAGTAGAEPTLTKLGDFLKDPGGFGADGKPLAVQVAPADKVEDLASHLGRLALVAIEFPNPGDGRGYTSARMLRQRFGFKGEIRAVGAGVKQDLLFFMARCGIDSFDLAPGENEAEARASLHRFTLAYQPAVRYSGVREARFTASR
jgi:uncharacterized protein (DUF934 family)